MTNQDHQNLKGEIMQPAIDIDQELASLADDWQAQPYPKTDVDKLIKQTKRRVFNGKLCLFFDVLATIAVSIGFFYGLYVGEWDTATLIYLGFGAAISPVFVIYNVRHKLQAWSNVSDSPSKAIDNAMSSCYSSIKYTQSSKYACYLLLPAVNWYIYQIATTSEKSLFLPLLFVNLFVLLVWGISQYFHLKRKKELARLKQFK